MKRKYQILSFGTISAITLVEESLAIQNGVTIVRSAGDIYLHIIQLRDKIESGRRTVATCGVHVILSFNSLSLCQTSSRRFRDPKNDV